MKKPLILTFLIFLFLGIQLSMATNPISVESYQKLKISHKQSQVQKIKKWVVEKFSTIFSSLNLNQLLTLNLIVNSVTIIALFTGFFGFYSGLLVLWFIIPFSAIFSVWLTNVILKRMENESEDRKALKMILKFVNALNAVAVVSGIGFLILYLRYRI